MVITWPKINLQKGDQHVISDSGKQTLATTINGKRCKSHAKLEHILITLLAHISPQALHRDLGPAGPRRIAGVDFSLIPQCWHLRSLNNGRDATQTIIILKSINK